LTISKIESGTTNSLIFSKFLKNGTFMVVGFNGQILQID
jgi:hypothetical protein